MSPFTSAGTAIELPAVIVSTSDEVAPSPCDGLDIGVSDLTRSRYWPDVLVEKLRMKDRELVSSECSFK